MKKITGRDSIKEHLKNKFAISPRIPLAPKGENRATCRFYFFNKTSSLFEKMGIRGISFLGVILLVFTHCNDPQEGCLDANAKNYDVSVDDPCEDCCEYPTFTVSYVHQFDSLLLNTNAIDTNDLQQIFQIHDFSYFLTDFQLVSQKDTNGINIVNIIDTDTLQLYNAIEDTTIVNNFSLVRPNTRSDVLGLLQGNGRVDSLKFNIGIAIAVDSLLHPDLGVIQQQVELRKQYIRNTNPDIIYQVVVETDSLGNPTETLNLVAEKFSWGETPPLYKEITLPYVLDVAKSIDYGVNLSIDYDKWFKKLNLVEQTNSEMLAIILDSIPGSIKIIE